MIPLLFPTGLRIICTFYGELCLRFIYDAFFVMAWNSKAPSEQDWESVSLYIAKATEVPKRLQSSNHEIEGDGGVDSGSVYSSGGVGFYSSELGHGSSSKSFISTSANSSSMEGVKTFTTVDTSPKDFSATNEFSKVDSGGNFPRLEASIGSCEPMIGLNLGKRIYFENICTASTSNVSSLSLISTSSAAATKRSRTSYQRTQTPHCQVEGCNLDLRSAKDYHRRHRICESHSKSPKVIVAGMERRFCQQCSRFHDLSEFDDKKRSCRRRLFDHNARRRRPQPDPIQFKSAVLSSSLYGERQPMNYVLNRGPVPAANSTWQAACSFMVTPGSGSLLGSGKVGGIGRQLHLPADEMSNAISTLHFDSHGVSSFKGGTNHVLDQGLAANAIASNLDAAPDRQRALSLLSNNSWGLNDHKPSSLEQLMHANQASVSQAVLHAESQSWAVSSSECLQDEQLSSEKNRGSSQFQEFQLFKAPYDIGCFYSNQIN